MNPLGRIPGQPVNSAQQSTREGQIYFELPNDATLLPDGSTWLIGYRVSMPYIPGGASDADPSDNWVSMQMLHTVVP